MRQPQELLYAAEQLIGKGHFGRAVHFGFDDIDAAGAAVFDAIGTVAFEVVNRNRGSDHGIHDAFGDFLAVCAPQNGGVGHQVANVAQEHQRAAMQGEGLAVGGGVLAVGVQAACQGLAAFFKRFGQRAFQNAQPVAVAQHFVFGIYGGYGVFQIQNGGDGGLYHHIGHACRIGLANGRIAVNDDVDMQAVVEEQHRAGAGRIPLVADKLGGIF